MDWLDSLLVASGAVYLGALAWLWCGLRRRPQPVRAPPGRVSVVVAARNEQETLDACLEALRAQDYDGDWEVVVVDDRSEDETAERVRHWARSWKRLKLVQVRGTPRFRCPKKSALACGIEASSGELLLFTDADCRPPPGWVRSTAGLFADEVGLVAGYAFPDPGRSLWQRLLALDNLAIGVLSAGSFGMGRPLACTGRNLAYRRLTYEQVGGFGAIGHLVGGDDVYFARLVAARTKWKLIFNRDPEAAMHCRPPPSRWGEIVQQKLRHAAKAGNYRGPALLLGAGVYLFHLALLGGLARMAWQARLDLLLSGVWATRWVADWALLRVMALGEERRLLLALPLLELCYIPYVLLFTLIGRMGWFRWKG